MKLHLLLLGCTLLMPSAALAADTEPSLNDADASVAKLNTLSAEERMKMSPQQLDSYYQGILKQVSPDSAASEATSSAAKRHRTSVNLPHPHHVREHCHTLGRATGKALIFTAKLVGVTAAAAGKAAQNYSNNMSQVYSNSAYQRPAIYSNAPTQSLAPQYTNFSVSGPGMQYHTGTITRMGSSINITEY